MTVVRLQSEFAPPAFMRAVRVTPCAPQPAASHGIECLAARSSFDNLIVPALANAQDMSILSSFLVSRDRLVDAIENAWNEARARSFWMTSDTRLRESYQMADDSPRAGPDRAAQDRALNADFDPLLDCAVLRFGPFHAKFVLTDPLGEQSTGYITSCNLIADAFQKNHEVILALTRDECRQLYRFARHAFWHLATTELAERADQVTATAPFEAALPEPEGTLVWTAGKSSTLIRQNALRIIREAETSIDICGHSWTPDHPVLAALAEKARQGVKVRLLGWRFSPGERQPPIHKRLAQLIDAGVEVMEVPKLHAKLLLNEREGMLCTANFATKGLDEGVEVGVLLDDRRLTDARKAFDYFASHAETRCQIIDKLPPDTPLERDVATYRPEFPDSPLRTQGSRTLDSRILTSTCASTVQEEAQEALRALLEEVANPKDPLATWTRQEAGKSSNPRILDQKLVVSVEMRPPTLPSKLRAPDSDPTTPQVVEHKGRKWVVIPDPGADHVLMAQAVALAKQEGCNVAFWA